MRDFGIKLEANNLEELRKKLEEMEKLKRQLLEHYADRYPNRFYQYDGFVVEKTSLMISCVRMKTGISFPVERHKN